MSLTHLPADLVPARPIGPGYDYFCTWASQNYLFGQGLESLSMDDVLTGSLEKAQSLMHESRLVEPGGWLSLYPQVREDLWFLLDDGYYLHGKNSMEIDPVKFPSCTGDPQERQVALSAIVKKGGWRGLGLWSRGELPEPEARQRVLWSRAAGVGYWKIDGGDNAFLYPRLRDELYPELVLEHAQGEGPFNLYEGHMAGPGYASPLRREMLRHSDALRIYDVDQPLNEISALDRVAALLHLAAGDPDAGAIIHVEDNLITGAALGCSFGVFRFPYIGRRPSGDPEIFLAGPRQARRRMDEVTRTVRWHRLAPPFAANRQELAVDTLRLVDTWNFSLGDTWDREVIGPRSQSAPARISRGLPLPEVTAWGQVPFVLSSRHPDGPVAIATLGRQSNAGGYVIPPADICQKITGTIPPAIGIFGHYKRLDFYFEEPLVDRQILAQDLAGGEVTDITRRVDVEGHRLSLSGDLIRETGLSAATPGDLSDPGLVLVIR